MICKSYSLLLCALVALPLSSCSGGADSSSESETTSSLGDTEADGTSGAANSSDNPDPATSGDAPIGLDDLCVAPESGGSLGYGLEASCRPLKCGDACDPCAGTNGGECPASESPHACNYYGQCVAVEAEPPARPDGPISRDDLCVAPESGGSLGYGLDATCRPLECGDTCDPCEGANGDKCPASELAYACNYYGQCVAVLD